MRVVVKIPSHAYAELVAELERVPARERAERLRVLASIGLMLTKTDSAKLCCGKYRLEPMESSEKPNPSAFRRVRDQLKSGLT